MRRVAISSLVLFPSVGLAASASSQDASLKVVHHVHTRRGNAFLQQHQTGKSSTKHKSRMHKEVSMETVKYVPVESFETDTSAGDNVALPEEGASEKATPKPSKPLVAVAQIKNEARSRGIEQEKTFEVDSPDDFGSPADGADAPAVEKLDAGDVLEGASADAGEHEAATRIEVQMQNAKNLYRMKKERDDQQKYRQEIEQFEAKRKREAAMEEAIKKSSEPVLEMTHQNGAQVVVGKAYETASQESGAATRMPAHVVQMVNTKTTAKSEEAQDPVIVAEPVTGGSGQPPPGSGSAAIGPQGVRPKGWDQCVKFARNMKSHGVMGVELIRTWKSTCEPAVQSGVATERYKLMCASLGGAVEPFSKQLDYDVFKLCDSVLTLFHDVLAQ